MLIYIDNKDKNWAGVDAWLKQRRNADGTITPDVALETLKMTNLDANLYFIVKEINKLDVDKHLEYKDFVVSAVQGREHDDKVYSALKALAEDGGYIEEFEKADSDIKIYNSKVTKGVVLDDYDKLKACLGKDFVIVANISDNHTTVLGGCDLGNVVELNYVKDCRQVLLSAFTPHGTVSAQNLPKKMDFSGCFEVYFNSCDLAGVESIVLQDGGIAHFTYAENLPKNLDLSRCSVLYLEGCDLSGIRGLSMAKAEEIYMEEAYNFPKNLDLSNCKELHLKGSEFLALDNLKFRDGAKVKVSNAYDITKKFDASNLGSLEMIHCSFKDYNKITFASGSKIKLEGCWDLPEVIDFSRCERGDLSGCNMLGVKKLVFKDQEQRNAFLHYTNSNMDDVKITFADEVGLFKSLRDRFSKE